MDRPSSSSPGRSELYRAPPPATTEVSPAGHVQASHTVYDSSRPGASAAVSPIASAQTSSHNSPAPGGLVAPLPAAGPSSRASAGDAAASTWKKKALPSQSALGETLLPVARVQRIIKADPDVAMSSKEAIFLISKMTERFLRKLAEAGYTSAQLGGRRTLEYKDLASAVRDDEAFHFLTNIVPVRIRLDEAQEKRRKRTTEDGIDATAAPAVAATLPTLRQGATDADQASAPTPLQPSQPLSTSDATRVASDGVYTSDAVMAIDGSNGVH